MHNVSKVEIFPLLIRTGPIDVDKTTATLPGSTITDRPFSMPLYPRDEFQNPVVADDVSGQFIVQFYNMTDATGTELTGYR